jgi:hypothetical protein
MSFWLYLTDLNQKLVEWFFIVLFRIWEFLLHGDVAIVGVVEDCKILVYARNSGPLSK